MAEALSTALDVASSVAGEEAEDAARAHVHGFHTYAARLHPVTASRAVAALSNRGDVVLDPFCGSGTVLVEARRLGRRAMGVDANPLAVRLASLKVTPADATFRAALLAGAERVAAVAESRRKARVGASRRYPPEDVEAFAPHVLLELDGLRMGLLAEHEPRVRSALHLVLSAILVKVSQRAGDTAEHGTEKRIAAGFPTKLFTRKTTELTERMAEIAPALAAGPEARAIEGDARELQGIAPASVGLVLSSPPYPGVYDYAVQHALRLRWLGLRADRFEDEEIGARRHAQADPRRALVRYRDDLGRVLQAAARTMRPGGCLVFVIADGIVGRDVVRVDELVAELAPAAGLKRLAIASQARPHFHDATAAGFRERPRQEHALALQRPGRR